MRSLDPKTALLIAFILFVIWIFGHDDLTPKPPGHI